MKGLVFLSVFLSLFLISVAVAGEKTPEKLFEIETGDRIENVNFVQDDSIVTIRRKSKLWAYDNVTGKELWKADIKGVADDAFGMMWNDKLYMMPLKKGIVAYDIKTGNKLWESKAEAKMSDFVDYHNFKDIFLLEFKNNLMAVNPETGNIAWTAELNYSKDAEEAGAALLHNISKEWGGRMLILGKKGPYLLDTKDGEVLWQSEKRDLSDEIEEPVHFIGDELALIVYEKGVAAVNLEEGKEAWYLEQEIEDPNAILSFTGKDGKLYAMFSFKDFILMFDAQSGKQLWKSGPDLQGRVYNIEQQDGDLLLTATRNNWSGQNKGGHLVVYRVKLEDGSLLWQRSIGMAQSMSVNFKIPIIGIKVRQNFVWYRGPIKTPQGWLYQIWGTTYKVGESNTDWGYQKGGEGLVMVDPKTGALLWKTYPGELYDYVKDEYQRIAQEKQKGGERMPIFHPGHKAIAEMIPEPVIEGDAVYFVGAEGLVKASLTDGKILWQSPKYGYVPSFFIRDGYVYGRQGTSQWSFYAKGDDANEMILASKKHGYFCLDAKDGKEAWAVKDSKKPFDLFGAIVGDGGKAIFISDGEKLRRLDFKPDAKKFAWEVELDKVTGEIGEKGIVTKLVSSSFNVGAGGSWSSSKTYSHSMENGIWGFPNGDILILAEEGPARITPDGKVAWKLEWEWKSKKVNFTPKMLQNLKYIVYQYKNRLYCVDLESGKISWMTKESKDAMITFDGKEKNIYVIDDDVMTAYRLGN